MAQFADWIVRAHKRGKQVIRKDRSLAAFIKSRQEQIKGVLRDRKLLLEAVGEDTLDQEITAEAIKTLQPSAQISSRRRASALGQCTSSRRTPFALKVCHQSRNDP
jgi:hypothetical protein